MSEQIELYDALSQNFIEYAAAVNGDRSIPDATTGLKPVARRILWSMYSTGLLSSKPHVKSAHVVGNVLATLHPHGEASVYGALVRLSQDWIMRYPLIDIHGNMGNITGDGPASMRYTEARLASLAEEGLFTGIKKKNVDFTLTYDDSAEEPVTLPAIFPNLLCNPNMGIGVAISANWAPHNLTEVTEAILDYLDGKEPKLPGPDFPTGGIIINKNDIPAIMKTGTGTVKIRGCYTLEKNKIIFYEIPYGITIEKILNEIDTVCEKQQIQGIIDIRDESTKKGIRIVIECESNIDLNIIVKQLFAKTSLQTTFSYNQMALVNKTPTLLNLKDCIEIYIEHNLECIRKEADFDLKKVKARQHIVEGLLKALGNINNIIALIKRSSNTTEAKDNLIKRYNFTEEQAKAIIDMKLGRLANLEKIELEKENQELKTKARDLNSLVCNEEERINLLGERLTNLVEKYGDKRRTQLAQIDEDININTEPTFIAEPCIFTLDNKGYARMLKKSAKVYNNTLIKRIDTKTDDVLFYFSSAGKVYRMPLKDFPHFSIAVSLKTYLKLNANEKILAICTARTACPRYTVFFTKKGLVKKTLTEEYLTLKKNNGIIALKIKDNDSIVDINFIDEEDIVLVTKQGKGICFPTKNIKPIGRNTSGVKGINLNTNDEIIAGIPLFENITKISLAAIAGEKYEIPLNHFTEQSNGGKGITLVKNITLITAKGAE